MHTSLCNIILCNFSWRLLIWLVHVYVTSLNPVPNAQVCVFAGTYYKITTTNYISKTSLYTTFHVSIKTLATENLDVCTACDLANICWVCCWYWYQNLWGAPPRAWHAFPRQRHMRRGGVIYFCQGFLPCMMPSMDGWMDEKFHDKQPRRPLLHGIE